MSGPVTAPDPESLPGQDVDPDLAPEDPEGEEQDPENPDEPVESGHADEDGLHVPPVPPV